MRTHRFWVVVGLLFALGFVTKPAAAADAGEFIETDSLGLSLLTHDFTTDATTSISDHVNLSEYIGVHYYFADRLRLGGTFQATQRITPAPEPGSTRFQRFAFLPQLGINFYDPFYFAVIYGIAPYTRGRTQLDMTVEGALGMSVRVSESVRFSVAAVVPYAFYYHRSIGLTAVTGLAFRL